MRRQTRDLLAKLLFELDGKLTQARRARGRPERAFLSAIATSALRVAIDEPRALRGPKLAHGRREHLRVACCSQFYRAHTGTITGVEGTGLGLSIVKETVESLGGRVWAEFPDEGGSVFSFSLPSRREEDAAAAGTRRPDALTNEGDAR